MYGSHKIIPHTIKRAIPSQCFIDAYCPATVATESQGTNTGGVGIYGYNPGLARKLLPIVLCWQDMLFALMPGAGPDVHAYATLLCYPTKHNWTLSFCKLHDELKTADYIFFI